MDKLEDLVKRAEESRPYRLDYMGIHYGNGCPIELRKRIYNKAIDDVIKMVEDGMITNKKSLLNDLEQMKK